MYVSSYLDIEGGPRVKSPSKDASEDRRPQFIVGRFKLRRRRRHGTFIVVEFDFLLNSRAQSLTL